MDVGHDVEHDCDLQESRGCRIWGQWQCALCPRCVAGSTNQNSSLSGNQTVEGDGQPVNVTISPGMAGLDPRPSTAGRCGSGTATGSASARTSTDDAMAMGGRGVRVYALVVAAGLGLWSIG